MPIATTARIYAPALTLAALLAGASGCASSGSSTQKELQALREELTLTQTAQDRLDERLAALEVSASAPSSPAPAAQDESLLARPSLEVVRVEPGAEPPGAPAVSEASAADAEEPGDSERPLIRGEGSRLEAHMQPAKPPPAQGRKVGRP